MDQVYELSNLLSPSLLNDISDRFRGCVDRFDPESGVSGWALNFDAPDDPVILEMFVEDQFIARCSTGIYRDDVAALLKRDVFPGFKFAEEAIARLRQIALHNMNSHVVVRIANSTKMLAFSGNLPALRQLFPEELASPGPDLRADFDLPAHLSALREEALALVSRPLRPLPEQMTGFIEALAIDESGYVWLAGWMGRTNTVDCTATILDRQKIPAGFAFSLFDRADLPEGNCGVIGVLFTNWRPSPTAEVYLYMGREGRSYLRNANSMQVVQPTDFNETYLPLLQNGHTGHIVSLLNMLTRPERWTLSGRAVGFPTSACLERVLVLPEFGALVTGWVASPLKQVRSFALRMGSSILPCDLASLSFSHRQDVASIFPGNDKMLQRAGFVGAFRGNFQSGDLLNPILKVLYSDGTSSNHAVDLQSLSQLGQGVGFEAALSLFPSLSSEPFFADFAAALRHTARAGIGECRPYMISPARYVLVFVVPNDRCDMFLLLTMVNQAMRLQTDPPGVVFVSGTGDHRATLLSLFEALRAESAISYSLFLMDDPSYALYCLPEMLSQVGASGFVFIAASVFLTETGWQAAIEAVKMQSPIPTLLEIEDPVSPARGASRSAQCFVWSSRAFIVWMSGAPIFLTGFHEDNGISVAAGKALVQRGAARRSRWPVSLPFVTAVNRLAAI